MTDWLKCNFCGEVFRDDNVHECDYDFLKKQNKELRESVDFYAERMRKLDKYIHNLELEIEERK